MTEEAVATETVREADHCPACGSASMRTLFHGTDRLFATTTNSFEVVECTECRLLRLFPQPTAAELNNYYPPNYWFAPGNDTASRAEDFYRRLVLGDHIRFVERAIGATKARGPLLDVGCGGGLFLRLLREHGHKVMGLDFSMEAAHTAWSVNRVPAMCATLSRAPLRPESFSVLTMFHVLEHLFDPVSYVEEAYKLLAPDGRLVVQVPNAASWQFLLFGQNWNGIDVPRHLVNFKEKDIVMLLETCGFEIVRRKFFSLRDNPAGMATSISAALDPMGRRVRKVPETPAVRLCKDLVYLGLTLLCLPFTLIEAGCRAGSTIMIEARKK
ncbi:MAG: class I SAM-dependent methyltransferase [Acidobacteria bacterium]|nr:class I SAM-dependent methyltransferase [Acidobacteriota bacterium]